MPVGVSDAVYGKGFHDRELERVEVIGGAQHRRTLLGARGKHRHRRGQWHRQIGPEFE
jgi:hypothetical protein